MDSEWLVRLLYGVVIIAVVFVLFLGKKQERMVRHAADAFALAFLRLANRISPRPITHDPSPKTVRSIMTAAVLPEVVGFYNDLAGALEQVHRACGRNGRLKEQFAQPIQEIFDITRGFLVYCEHGGDDDLQEEFTRFLGEQASYRQQLFKRISRDAGEEFARLNRDYPLGAS